MAEILRTWAIESRGKGNADYSAEVSAAYERKGLRIEYLQALKIFTIVFSAEALPFTPYVWVQPPLVPGAAASLVDSETGFAMPYTVPLGYTATIVDFGMGLTEDAIMWTYMSGFVLSNAGVYPGGTTYYENRIQAISTAVLDPTGALALSLEFRITNLGAGNLEGQIAVTGYLEAVGTPPLPLEKTVRCKWCGHEHTVPYETTNIICPECGKLFIVYSLSKIRKMG